MAKTKTAQAVLRCSERQNAVRNNFLLKQNLTHFGKARILHNVRHHQRLLSFKNITGRGPFDGRLQARLDLSRPRRLKRMQAHHFALVIVKNEI